MISDTLQKARDFEAQYAPHIPAAERPAFHVTAPIGWINDPNGFSCYKGEYHLFYQHHPYSTNWGPMHWGHVKTRDFIRWEQLPVAIAPDTDADRDGCFSGSALELPDGRQMLMYTGVYRMRRPDGRMEEFQQQCLAFGDGVNYEKYPGNPVLDGSDLPAGGSVLDFRDPKIWQEDGTFYMVAGNRTEDGSGAIRLFESKDGLKWTYSATLDASRNEYGRMWECPDFFPLDGRQVLLVSPQEMTAIGLEFHAGYGVAALLGSYDKASRHFEREAVQAVDYGTDFYAPQTLETYDGRRIMIAWMQNWATTGSQPQDCRWFGQMTLPRELSIREGRLIQNPVRELANYHGRKVSYRNILLTAGEVSLHGVEGRLLDMTVTVRPVDGSPSYQTFKLRLAKDGNRETVVRYKVANSTVRIDRTHSGFPYDIVNVRDFPVRPQGGAVKLRIVMDRYSLEVFVNDGEQAASMTLYTPQSAQAVSFEVTEGAARIDVEKYSLELGEESKS